MKFTISLFVLLIISFGILVYQLSSKNITVVKAEEPKYWFLLERKSQKEFLYLGVPGEREKSSLVKNFKIKTGIPDKKPTPLPKLLGKDYWLIIKKEETENPETAPYFLSLNIPVSEEEPFGPENYPECEGFCNWEIPGEFGLHGVNGDETKLSVNDYGSSGCIRHSDENITYLYNLLNPVNMEIRYYIEDI